MASVQQLPDAYASFPTPHCECCDARQEHEPLDQRQDLPTVCHGRTAVSPSCQSRVWAQVSSPDVQPSLSSYLKPTPQRVPRDFGGWLSVHASCHRIVPVRFRQLQSAGRMLPSAIVLTARKVAEASPAGKERPCTVGAHGSACWRCLLGPLPYVKAHGSALALPRMPCDRPRPPRPRFGARARTPPDGVVRGELGHPLP